METSQTKWNWGAFLLPVWFAFANRSYLNLLALVPVLNIFWIFYGAFKGESWALNNPRNDYQTDREFRKVMDSWNRAGIAMLIFTIVILGLYLILGASIAALLFNSENFPSSYPHY